MSLGVSAPNPAQVEDLGTRHAQDAVGGDALGRTDGGEVLQMEQGDHKIDGPNRPPRMLVVEDDEQMAYLLQEVLADAGYTTVSVNNGQAALRAARDADLVLIDMGLPDLDGTEVVGMLRETPDLARLPIIALTGRASVRDRVRGIESGADDYVTKPFDADELLARIRALLRGRQVEVALRERTRALDTLRRLTTTLVNNVAVEELAQQIVDAVPDAFGRDSGFIGGVISTVDKERSLIRARAITAALSQQVLTLLGRPLDEIENVFDPPKNLQHEVALSGEPRDGDHLAQFIAPTVPSALAWGIEQLIGLRGAVAHPIKVQGQPIGVFLFGLVKPVTAITHAERGLMTDFATSAGIALENVRLYTAAERLTRTDALTGIANRRHFDTRLDEELARASRYNYHLGLLLIDVDFFKAYNDTHGHQAGDDALRSIARALRTPLRSSDLVARYGGEEFAILLPETNRVGLHAVGERVRRAVAGETGVTISIGGAMAPVPDGAALIAAADAALYAAKEAGRNQTVIAEPLGSDAPATPRRPHR